jgi:hypothetical protein
VAADSAGDVDDLADGAAVPDAQLRVLLRTGRRVGGRDELGRLERPLGQLHVRPQCLQTHLSPKGELCVCAFDYYVTGGKIDRPRIEGVWVGAVGSLTSRECVIIDLSHSLARTHKAYFVFVRLAGARRLPIFPHEKDLYWCFCLLIVMRCNSRNNNRVFFCCAVNAGSWLFQAFVTLESFRLFIEGALFPLDVTKT